MYRDAHKKRCQSEDCVRLHKIEKGLTTGDLEIDFMRSAWSREKKRQKRMARSQIEKRCQRAYWSAWMAKRYRKPATQKQTEEPKEITEKLIKSRIKDKRKWALMTPMKRKISYFVRETNSGRRHMANRKGSVKMRDMLEKLRQQGSRCALSGELIDHQNCEIDHIVPVSRGGSSDIENLQFVSKRMNRMKGTMTNNEFVEACKLVVQHTVPPLPHPLLGPLWSK
jgi:5-methylcytosine-specific restriction endonuclease McrA